VVVDTALAIGTGAVAGLWGGAPAGASGGTAPNSGWSGVQAPLPSGPDAPSADPGVTLSSSFTSSADHVSCASALSCAAVGYYEGGGSGDEHALIETDSGGSWTPLEAPLPSAAPADATSSMSGVSCASDGTCVAVGTYKDSSDLPHAVIDTLANGNWINVPAQLPSDVIPSGESFLKSVDCVSATSCMAVGSYEGSSGLEGFVDTLSGGTWSATPLPAPAGAAALNEVFPDFVSCPALGGCAVSGLYEYGTGPQLQAYLLAQGPLGWATEDAPEPSDAASGTNADSFLQQVSCATGVCEAVGEYKDTSGNDLPLIDRVTGGVWGNVLAPLPGNVGTGTSLAADLSGVSCTFDGCAAVGSYEDTANGTRPLVETTVNTTGATTGAEAPQPSDLASGSSVNGQLDSVSCLSLNECSSVGFYETGAGGRAPLIDSGPAGALTNAATDIPNSAASGASENAQLEGVACTARGSCLAAGFLNDTSGHTQGLLETYTPAEGYWTNASDGGVFSYPNAMFHGSAGSLVLNQPVVGMAATPGDGGYWEVASDGGIFAYGDAPFYGSRGGQALNKPIVGMAATPDGGGYWLVASDGGIFAYGDAQFYGSTGSIKLNKPIVGMAATPDGQGYWLVASDGGVFNYGDAGFDGSRGGQSLNKPIVGMAGTATGQGYWLVASDGGIFTYGDAQFYGSTGSIKLNKPIVTMMSTFDGGGYWLVASDGGIFNYGDAGFSGSAGSLHLNKPMVNGAST
jgi:hypothetical protein